MAMGSSIFRCGATGKLRKNNQQRAVSPSNRLRLEENHSGGRTPTRVSTPGPLPPSKSHPATTKEGEPYGLSFWEGFWGSLDAI